MVFLSLLMRDLDRHIHRAEGELAARKLAEEQLLHAQRLEALGRLAGTVAHDFNNYLTTILGYSELMRAVPGNGQEIEEGLKAIRTAAHSASSLTRQLLAFSRKQAIQAEVFPLNTLIENLGGILRQLAGEAVKVELQLDPRAGNIEADPGQVEQVLVNLVANARDAMPLGGRLTIATGGPQPPSEPGSPAATQRRVCLMVSDTGVGMDQDTLGRVFEPFFTTKPKGQGVGLGLATVYRIVQENRGSIQARSAPGQGATFAVSFPESPREPTLRERLLRPAREIQGTETILVADDDASIRRVTVAGLTQLGYQVIEAADGAEALQRCAAPEQRIDLLVTDVVIPGIDGVALGLQAQRLRPQLRVILITGYSGEAADAGRDPVFPLLRKPFMIQELAGRIREILDAAGARQNPG
jgi:nitrogen-specific signal transduction histidine kinase/CheY-like chemotaxis protein